MIILIDIPSLCRQIFKIRIDFNSNDDEWLDVELVDKSFQAQNERA